MKLRLLTVTALAALLASLAIAAEESNPIKDAMDFAHKAPKGEKKLNENIRAFIDHINHLKPHTVKGVYVKSITVSATMSPGVKVIS